MAQTQPPLEVELVYETMQPAFLAAGAAPAQLQKEKLTQLDLLKQMEPEQREPIADIWGAAEQHLDL